MRYLNLHPFGIVALICIIAFAGCASKGAEPPRETIVFDYTPQSEAAAGSANVTFAVVGTQLGKPAQQGVMQLPSQTPVPLYVDFASTMTKDFMEVLGAHGFGVRGPFKTYNDMIHPDKEGSDLILTAEVIFAADTRDTELKESTFLSTLHGVRVYSIVGPVTLNYDVKLVVSESLTNERMWTKSITIEPFTIQLKSHTSYSLSILSERSMKYGKVFQGTGGVPIEVILEKENKFHGELGHALEEQYKEILGKIYTYLDPREMTIVKNQAMELRKKKVY